MDRRAGASDGEDRDLNLLTDVGVLPGTQLHCTITTLDPVLWRLVEPSTSPPAQRQTVMR
jgi:DNA repair photolyase